MSLTELDLKQAVVKLPDTNYDFHDPFAPVNDPTLKTAQWKKKYQDNHTLLALLVSNPETINQIDQKLLTLEPGEVFRDLDEKCTIFNLYRLFYRINNDLMELVRLQQKFESQFVNLWSFVYSPAIRQDLGADKWNQLLGNRSRVDFGRAVETQIVLFESEKKNLLLALQANDSNMKSYYATLWSQLKISLSAARNLEKLMDMWVRAMELIRESYEFYEYQFAKYLDDTKNPHSLSSFWMADDGSLTQAGISLFRDNDKKGRSPPNDREKKELKDILIDFEAGLRKLKDAQQDKNFCLLAPFFKLNIPRVHRLFIRRKNSLVKYFNLRHGIVVA